MKKLLALGMGLIALLLVLILATFGLMHTRYLTPSAQWLTDHLWPGELTFTRLEYDYPRHFRLQDVTLEQDEKPLHFQQVDVWLSARPWQDDKWVIDSLLLNGANFSAGLPSHPFLSELKLNQLALHNIDFAMDGLIARGVNLQVKNPSWHSAVQRLPYGELQLSAEQFYWHSEAIDNVLVDADYQPADSTVYGASFIWRGARFSGQAEQYPQGWSLVNVTINQLNLDQDLTQLTAPWWPLLSSHIARINSLDILNSNLRVAGSEMTNLALSAENLQLGHTWWQQQQGYLSLNADSITSHGLQWVEPSFKLDFEPDKIQISDFSSEVLQGSLQLSGEVTPNQLHLYHLTARGLKWFGEQDSDWHWLSLDLSNWQSLQIDQFDLHNLQLIQLQHTPAWQLTGLNAEGRDTELMRDGKWGLWQGSASISANNASIGSVLSSQGIIEMHSDNGRWSLDRAFLPLEKGYIDANAEWNFAADSAPWKVALHTDGLPLTELHHWLTLPFSVDALADLDLNAEGLAGDYSMLAHSLSGELQLGLRRGILTTQQTNQLVVQPFTLDRLNVSADRGRIQLNAAPLAGPGLDARLQGTIDLVAPQQGTLELQLRQGCQQTRFDLLRNQQAEETLPAKACADTLSRERVRE